MGGMVMVHLRCVILGRRRQSHWSWLCLNQVLMYPLLVGILAGISSRTIHGEIDESGRRISVNMPQRPNEVADQFVRLSDEKRNNRLPGRLRRLANVSPSQQYRSIAPIPRSVIERFPVHTSKASSHEIKLADSPDTQDTEIQDNLSVDDGPGQHTQRKQHQGASMRGAARLARNNKADRQILNKPRETTIWNHGRRPERLTRALLSDSGDEPLVDESEETETITEVAPIVQNSGAVEEDWRRDHDTTPVTIIDEHFQVIEPADRPLTVKVGHSLLMRTRFDVYRTAIVDPTVCDILQFTPREVSVIGKKVGSTNVTFWFDDEGQPPLNYVLRVEPDIQARKAVEDEYRMLAQIISELFPDSKVELIPVANKLIVRGQAKDSQEAADVMRIIRREAGGMGTGQGRRGFGGGVATRVLLPTEMGDEQGRNDLQIINMLRVPGPQQVMLKVKIAELSRSAARGFGVGVDTDINVSDTAGLFINSMLNLAAGDMPSVVAQFDGDDISFGIRWLEQEGVIRKLSEPTLVTLSGRSATFVAGGEFAVPTVVGVGGVGAVTTDFRTFGAVISFLPVVIDKDLIRLQVAPEFSQINSGLNSANTFGLNARAVTTTVEMREGQTLAIAGLLDESMNASKTGDVPILSNLFGRRDVNRNETELIILVTPELVHPLEPEEVPPLPGFDVSEPTSHEFVFKGRLEGNPTQDYRSTIWPRLRHRYQGNGPAMISGHFGHGQ